MVHSCVDHHVAKQKVARLNIIRVRLLRKSFKISEDRACFNTRLHIFGCGSGSNFLYPGLFRKIRPILRKIDMVTIRLSCYDDDSANYFLYSNRLYAKKISPGCI